MWWTRNDIREGMLVTSVAGQRLGKVIRCDADTFIIEKGVFFPKDYELRYDHITDVSEGTINYLLSDENTLRGAEASGATARERLEGRREEHIEPPMPADRWADRDDRLEEERLTSGGERDHPIATEPIGREGQPNAEEARMEAGQAARPADDDMIDGEEITVYREEVIMRKVPPSGQGTGAPSVH